MTLTHQQRDDNMVIVRAPVRVSFGGGGTDLAAYYEEHEGFVLSTSITRYGYVVARRPPDGGIHLNSADFGERESFRRGLPPVREPLILPKAVVEWFGQRGQLPDGLELFLATEVPPGTGLGSSSTITVALLKAIAAFVGEEYSETELAELASWIEIERLDMPIGKQDQYAAAVGGLNTIRFRGDGVTITPLPLPQHQRRALEMRLMLFSTGKRHNSADILKEQQEASRDDRQVIGRLHRIKALGEEMRDALQAGDLNEFGRLLDASWQYKRRLSPNISSPEIDKWYGAARDAGALGGKISGAGGGGYLLLYCPPRRQRAVRQQMASMALRELSFAFDTEGVRILNAPRTAAASASSAPAPAQKEAPVEDEIQQYWHDLAAITRRMPLNGIRRATNMLASCQRRGNTVYVVGNGGSASTASHIACDLAKGTRSNGRPTFRVLALNDNAALMTAWGNDASYERIFAEQLLPLVTPGDVLIAISTSGNSPNVVAAAELARAHHASVIALTGPERNLLARHATLHIQAPEGSIEQIEDVHMAIGHSLCVALRKELRHDGHQNGQNGHQIPIRANGSPSRDGSPRLREKDEH